MARVNRETGVLSALFATSVLPEPPASVVPGGSREEARLAALDAVGRWRGERLVVDPEQPLRLCLWYQDVKLQERYGPLKTRIVGERGVRAWGPEHVAAFRANQAVLAYSGVLRGPGDGYYGVTLDARTGDVLSIETPSPNWGMFSGGGETPKAVPIPGVPTASRPWRVGMGKGGWRAWTPPATAALVPAPKPPAKGTKVLLTDGRAAFPATYDAKANLLGISGKGYRPGEGLAKLLRKRAQTKSR